MFGPILASVNFYLLMSSSGCVTLVKKINNFTRAKIVAVVFRFDPGLSQWFQCSIRSVCNKKKQQTRK